MLSVAGLALLVAGAPTTVTIPGLGTVIGTRTIYGSEYKGYAPTVPSAHPHPLTGSLPTPFGRRRDIDGSGAGSGGGGRGSPAPEAPMSDSESVYMNR